MKKNLLIICLVFLAATVAGQNSLPVYERFPNVPPFKIIKLPDSSFYRKDDLRKKKATLIIVFSPDCDHCQVATKDLLANALLFKNVQIVMASYAPYNLIQQFYNDYKIEDYPNIVMGMDPGYFLGSYYNVRFFPSVFLYDKKGIFVKKYEGTVAFEKIAEDL